MAIVRCSDTAFDVSAIDLSRHLVWVCRGWNWICPHNKRATCGHRVFVVQEPYAAIAKRYGISIAYISILVKKVGQSKEFLHQKRIKQQLLEKRLEYVRDTVEAIQAKDGVVLSAQ